MTMATTARVAKRALVAAGAAVLCLVAEAATAAAPSYGDWSVPVNLGPILNGASNDQTPALTPDGLSLYFDSDRPGGLGGRDVWVSHRATSSSPWGAPVNVGAPVNTASADYHVAFSPDGRWMFFNSDRPGGFGRQDVYQSYRANVHDDFGWQAPTNLGGDINRTGDDGGPGYFENAGHPQLFFNSARDGLRPDLFLSDLQADGAWGPPARIAELNSVELEVRPTVRQDGLEILFYSDRSGGAGGNDLWTSTRATPDAPWTAPVNVAALNTSASDLHPYLSADARTLFFASTRAGGSGGADLYVTTRTAKLTVTADDQSRLFGQANPALTTSITGFVGGETSAVVSGTAACSTPATPASPAGDYPITCTVGSLSVPGYVFETFVAGTLTVGYSRPCLTGTNAGPLRVAAGEAICIGAGATHTGPVTVAPGGSLDVEGGRITGPVVANGAAAVRICGATITGPLTIGGSTGPIVVGGEGCDPNTVVGPVRVTDNIGGVEVGGNTVVGLLRVTGNAAPVDAHGNTVTGPVAIQT
jgi:hypothetical protein